MLEIDPIMQGIRVKRSLFCVTSPHLTWSEEGALQKDIVVELSQNNFNGLEME